MSVARRITQLLVEGDLSAPKHRVTQLLIEADHLEPVATRITQLMLEVDTRPPPVRTECHIVELTQTKDAYERISRIYPYGGGQGTERVTLSAATVSPPTGYTMDTTNNYLEYDAAPSRVDATVTWGDIGTQDDENATDASASNTLYYAAYNYLRQRITANEVYSLRVVGLNVVANPGETMRVTFCRYVDGLQAVGIDDDDLTILEATTEITPDGVRTVAMQLSTAEMWPDSDAGVAVDLERRVANLERGGGISLGRIGGGTGDGGSLPGTIAADSTNDVSDGLHTHQMDASADPGAAEELLKTNASGYLDLVRLIADAIHAETGADLTVQLGDNAGATSLSITDSDDAEVASIDSDGVVNIGASGRIQFADGTVTGTAVAGAVEYDDGTFYGTEVETRRAFSMSSGQITATTTVANTTTETTVFTGAIAADELRVGKVYRAGLYGSFSTNDASQALTLRSYVGSTEVGEIVLAPGNVTDEPWHGDITITVRSTGATGSVSTFTALFVEDEHDAMTEATTVDTTAAEDITLTAEWGAASAGNVFKVTQGYMEVLH